MEFYKKILKNTEEYKKYFAIGALLLVFIFSLNLFLSTKLGNPIEYVSSKAASSTSQNEKQAAKVNHLKTPKPVRGIYMTSWVAGTPKWRAELVDFVKKTEINSIVIDVKDYSGRVSFDTENKKIKEVGSEEIRVRDMAEFIEELHGNGIYAIARISVFQDPFYSKEYPQSAVKRKNGAIWKDRKGLSYVDPSARDFWDYIAEVGRASSRAGFDELNFDYIRFPSDGNMTDVVFPLSNEKSKADVLDEFFNYLERELKSEKDSVPISADVFGMTTTNADDLGIGQVLERVAEYFDYVSPMVYPSHYPPTFIGFKNPADHPYEVINHSMSAAVLRLSAPTSTPEKLRPWLQDFDLGATYDATMIREEKKAVYDSGLDSWLIWDPSNKYTRGAYDLE